ncbi:MAG: hypothetical protein V3U71_12960 [Cocleimonas sp.]
MKMLLQALSHIAITTAAILLLFTSSIHAKSPVGMNTNEVLHTDAGAPFVNLFKMAMPFKDAKKLTHGHVVFDKNGWPRNLKGGQAGSYMIHWLPAGSIPEGQYTVLYDGEGQLAYEGDAKIIHSQPGKDIVEFRSGHDKFMQVALIIKQSEPRNYLRNIRVLMPGGICANNPFKRVNGANQCSGNYQSFEKYHKQIVFNPDYLNFMKDFKVIRMMNISGITRNPMRLWNQMNQMNKATWAGYEGARGAPLEIMVKLANVLNRDAWFNLPHAADDNFVRQYASYLKRHLRPHLKAYIEYSNETWNTAFMQTHYTKQMGVKLRLDPDPNQAGHKYYSQRAVEIFKIFEQVYGNTQKLVRVMGAWSANRHLAPVVMEHKNAYKHVDAMAIAPYFFVHKKALGGVNSVPSVFTLLEDDKKNPYSMNNVYKMIQQEADLAKKYGVKLIAYEGGQHLTAPGTRSTRDHPNPFLIGANRAHPMEKFYIDFINNWDRISGGGLFMAFSAPRTCQFFGCWGIKEHLNQSDAKAPKYRALKRFF